MTKQYILTSSWIPFEPLDFVTRVNTITWVNTITSVFLGHGGGAAGGITYSKTQIARYLDVLAIVSIFSINQKC